MATDGKNNKSTPTEPVVPPKKDSSEHAAETPTVKPITEGEQQGGMEVTPGGDNNTLTVRYEKEVKPEEGRQALAMVQAILKARKTTRPLPR